MDLQLRGARALVTAASSGLGKACAAALADEGVDVFICARNRERLEQAALEIGAKGYTQADLTSGPDVSRVVNESVAAFGGLDILVTNVPDPKAGSFVDIDEADWSHSHEATLLTVVRLVRAATPYLARSRQAVIVNITSTAAKEFRSGRLLSSTYRAGVTSLAKHLSRELAPQGITVNNIAPGEILTSAWDRASAAAQAVEIPLRRLGEPAEVGALCAFLCSGQARFITGQTVVIDGGRGQVI
jgi:3-oxoacyl-[acyl-carrier protein] reductase